MKMKSIVGLFGAVALAAGSTAAHAIKMVDMQNDDPAADGARSVTYAKETLSKAAASVTEVDDVTYYNIARDHFISGPADVEGADESDYYISYVLGGVVFQTALTNDSLAVFNGDAVEGSEDQEVSATTFTRHSGGGMGDETVVFKLNDGLILPKNWLVLTAKFSIGESGIGGIARTVTNTTLPTNLPGIKTTATHSLPSAVRALPALKETVDAALDVPQAKALYEFMSFSHTNDPSDVLSVSVGTIRLDVAGGGFAEVDGSSVVGKQYRNALDDSGIGEVGSRVGALVDITGPHGTIGDLNNSVTFSGDFSFAKTAGFTTSVTSNGCTGITEVRKPDADDPEVSTDEIVPQSAGDFAVAQFLCIEVDGETSIPDTDEYQVTTKYKGLENAAFPPVGATHTLAKIERDGYDANIPYLTTDDGYNQRVILVNRWRATTYAFGPFESEDGVEVTEGEMVRGTLPEGTTVLRVRDIVTIDGGTRASGAVTVVAPADDIDGAVQQVNLMNRSVDTVYLDD
jgi:hypothetical protein